MVPLSEKDKADKCKLFDRVIIQRDILDRKVESLEAEVAMLKKQLKAAHKKSNS